MWPQGYATEAVRVRRAVAVSQRTTADASELAERLAASLAAHEAAGILPRRRSVFAKRAYDLVFATLILALTFPLYLLIALAIRLDSQGPALYRQVRIGKDGRPFTMYKFRTMYCIQSEQDE